MKRLLAWLLFIVLAGAATWWGWQRFRPLPAPVDLTKHDGRTIDFSSGRAVVKDSPADRAALDRAAKEMAEAGKDVTFAAPRNQPRPTPEPAKK